MSEDTDQSQKTEEPTAKKIADARKKGDAPKSQEFNTLFVLMMATGLLAMVGGPLAGKVAGDLGTLLGNAHQYPFTSGSIRNLGRSLVQSLLLFLAIPLACFALAGIAANVFQAPPVLTAKKLKPELSKISPIKGFSRVFGMQALVNFAKGIAKFVIVGTVTCLVLWPERGSLMAVTAMEPQAVFMLIKNLAVRLLMIICGVLFVLAVADYLYQRHAFFKKLRMTKQEVKDEHKQMEGDPHVKAKIRQVRMERGRKRMMAAVPEATVVVTNPTHFAVALKYERGEMNAPVVVAKGVDLIARKIRELAEQNKVPLVENPPLARALYASVEVDDEVPPEHYQAVAKVIGAVMKLRRR